MDAQPFIAFAKAMLSRQVEGEIRLAGFEVKSGQVEFELLKHDGEKRIVRCTPVFEVGVIQQGGLVRMFQGKVAELV